MTGFDEYGVSDTLGAILLVAVVAAAFSIIAVSFLSKPIQEQVPALSADITTSGNTISLRHNGGDQITKSELKILVDNQDKTSQFSMAGGGSGWSSWSIGDTLTFTGSSSPSSVQIVYNHGSSSQLLQSWGTPPSAYTPGPTTPITPTPTLAPEPVANFIGYPTSGTAPLTVTFTDSSTNSPTSWEWSFGDGGTATSRNATHQYLAGMYTVSLTATNSGGSNTLTRSGYIIADPTITASAGTGGIITPNGSVVVPYGNSQSFSILRNPGFHVADVLVNSGSVGAVTSYTFPSVTEDQTIEASFAQNPRTQIYYEGFESGTGSWSFTGDNSRQTGSVPKNQTASIRLRRTGTMTRTISTAGYTGIIAQFGWCAQSLDSSSEYVRAVYSTDGGSSWSLISQITGPSPSPAPTTLTIVTFPINTVTADNNSNFRLRFFIAGSATNDLLYVDDVKLTGIPN